MPNKAVLENSMTIVGSLVDEGNLLFNPMPNKAVLENIS